MRFLFAWCVMLLMCGIARGQDTVAFRVKYAVSGLFNNTNTTRSFLANNNASFTAGHRTSEASLSGNWIYGRQQSVLSNNDFTVVLDYEKNRKVSKLYWWALATYDHSYSLRINYRCQLAAGPGYTFVDRNGLLLVLSDGPLLETSLLQDTIRYQTVRNSLRLKYRLPLGKHLAFEGSNFWQPSLLDGSDYIVKLTNQCTFSLNTRLSLMLGLTYNLVSLTQRENTLLTFGLAIDTAF